MFPVNNKRNKSKLFFPLGQLLLDLKVLVFPPFLFLLVWNISFHSGFFFFLRTKIPSDLDLDASVTADFTGCQLSIVYLIDEIIMMYHA